MPSSPDHSPAWAASWCLAAALLSGCAALQPPAGTPPPPPTQPTPPPAPAVPQPPAPQVLPEPVPAPDHATLANNAARHLLTLHERLRDLGPADLQREQARLAGTSPSPATLLEQALVLAQTRQPGDLSRALTLLEPLARAPVPDPWAAPARLLLARLAEQRRLEEQAERQAVQLRDQQRRIDQLASQLEALKAIERSLATRPAPPPAPPASRPAAPSAPANGSAASPASGRVP